jgi:tetratricopeptide (TPR) repeat protein
VPHQLKLPSPKVARLLDRGRKAALGKSFTKATKLFSEALDIDKDCAFALFYRAQLHLLMGAPRAARADFKALEKVPIANLIDYRELDNLPSQIFSRVTQGRSLPAWHYVLNAFLLRTDGENDAAVVQMQLAVKAAPRNAAVRAFLGRVRVIYRYADAGAEDLAAASKMAPKCGWLRAWLGEARRRQGRHAQALRDLNAAVRLRPGYALAYVWRGAVQFALGKPRLALKDLDTALETCGDYFRIADDRTSFVNYTLGWALNARAQVRRAVRDLSGAVADVSRAHEINPRYTWVGAFSPSPADFRKGIAQLTRHIKARPGDVMARAWRGFTLLEAGDAPAALKDLTLATAKNGKRPWPRLWRGRAHSALGQTAKALADFSAVAKAHPQAPEAHAWRGGMLRAQGKLSQAVSALNRAIALDPINAWAYAWRGEAKMERGDWPGAERDFNQALAIHLEYAEAYAWRGEVKRRRGQPAAAIADFDQALKLAPQLKTAVVGKAAALGELGDEQAMVRVLQQAGLVI